eukprot:TRINITY_DN4031_c0_g1_i1.p1 TRINITY_DN4031_c0_g1~~TRINITY_DN4031_c0_g1_i1.p1  ORF type:complete len:165 (+),score=2.95 TRINITY_DN4031_c0_g1_i1:203-697(+)
MKILWQIFILISLNFLKLVLLCSTDIINIIFLQFLFPCLCILPIFIVIFILCYFLELGNLLWVQIRYVFIFLGMDFLFIDSEYGVLKQAFISIYFAFSVQDECSLLLLEKFDAYVFLLVRMCQEYLRLLQYVTCRKFDASASNNSLFHGLFVVSLYKQQTSNLL